MWGSLNNHLCTQIYFDVGFVSPKILLSKSCSNLKIKPLLCCYSHNARGFKFLNHNWIRGHKKSACSVVKSRYINKLLIFIIDNGKKWYDLLIGCSMTWDNATPTHTPTMLENQDLIRKYLPRNNVVSSIYLVHGRLKSVTTSWFTMIIILVGIFFVIFMCGNLFCIPSSIVLHKSECVFHHLGIVLEPLQHNQLNTILSGLTPLLWTPINYVDIHFSNA